MNLKITVLPEQIKETEVTLSVYNVVEIIRDYRLSCIKEYVSENYDDWSNDKIDYVSSRTLELLMKIEEENGDTEGGLINNAATEWEEISCQDLKI